MINRIVEFINMYFEAIVVLLFCITIVVSLFRIWRFI